MRADPHPNAKVSKPSNCARSPTPLRSVLRGCRASTRGFLATERGRSKDRTSAGQKVCPREVRTRLLSEHVRGFATSERSRQKAEARAGLQPRNSGAGGWGCARFFRLRLLCIGVGVCSRFYRLRLLYIGGWGVCSRFFGSRCGDRLRARSIRACEVCATCLPTAEGERAACVLGLRCLPADC